MICNNCGNSIETFNKFCPKCGAPIQFQASPAASPSPFGSPNAPMYSGPNVPPARKSSCGKIILILGIILILLLAGIAAAVYFGYGYLEKTLKSSEAYTVALTALKENPEVQEKMGDIQETGFPLGAFSQNSDGSGDAAFTMSVTGSRASGQYQVALKRRAGVWKIENGNVRLANGEVIQIAENAVTEDDPLNTNDNTVEDNRENVGAKDAVRSGVLNSKATTLPTPAYPSLARSAKASGTVVVEVLVDERGNVVDARAVSGHALLRPAAIAAARGAKFSPTLVNGKPKKVVGVLNFNFKAD